MSIGPRSAWTLPPPNNPSWWERWPGERRPNHERARSRSPRRPVPSGHDSTWPHPLPQPPWSFLRKSAMWFRWHLLWCQWPHLSYWNQRQEHQKINRKVQSGKYMSNRINKKDKSIYISSFQYFSEKTVWKDCFLVMFPSGKHINMPFRQTSTAPCRHISCATERQRVGKTIVCSACRGSGVGEHIYIYIYIYLYLYTYTWWHIYFLYIYIRHCNAFYLQGLLSAVLRRRAFNIPQCMKYLLFKNGIPRSWMIIKKPYFLITMRSQLNPFKSPFG